MMAVTQWQLPIHLQQCSSLVVRSYCGEEDMARRWREQARSMGGDVVTSEEDLRDREDIRLGRRCNHNAVVVVVQGLMWWWFSGDKGGEKSGCWRGRWGTMKIFIIHYR